MPLKPVASASRAPRPRGAAERYAVAAVLVSAALLLTHLLAGLLTATPFLLVFPAVAGAAWFGGSGPGLAAALLGGVGAAWLLFEPRFSFQFAPEQAVLLAAFVLVAAIISRIQAATAGAERRARSREDLLRTTLRSIGDGVISTDVDGRVTFLNPVAEALTGWPATEAFGRPLDEVFRIVSSRTREPAENPVERVLREGVVVGLANHTLLLARDGIERAVDDSGAPVRDAHGRLLGAILVFRDVSGRALDEDRLRESEETLRLALRGARVGAWSYDPQSGRVTWSENLEEVHGLPPGSFGGTFESFRELVHPMDRERVLAEIGRALREGSEYEVDFRILRPDGSTGWIGGRGRVVRDEEGRALRIVGIGLDLQREKTAQEALRKSEERFRELANSAPVMIWVADPHRNCTFLNRPWLEFTGRSLEEELGDGWTVGIHPDDREAALAAYAAAFETRRPFRTEVRLRRHDGAFRWILDTGVPLFEGDGRFSGFVGSRIDITERREAEEEREHVLRLERELRSRAETGERRSAFLSRATAALAASLEYETTLRTVAHLAVPEVADWCVVDLLEPDGSIRRVAIAHADAAHVERALEVHRRFPTDVHAGTGVSRVLRTGEPELYPEITDAMLESAARGPEHLQILRSWGLRSAMCLPMIARERTLGAVTFGFAESGRRYGPEDLQLGQHLARRAALAVDNARLFHEAQEANRAKDQFLATLSHELRTPLNAISGWTHLLRSGRLDAETSARAMETIERSVRLQAQLIDDLLDVSRIVTGKLRLELRPVEPAPAIEGALESVRPAAVAKGITLSARLDPAAGPVLVDVDRLQQVAWNLLSNAIKFAPRGGRVEVGLERFASQVRLHVSDDGPGIAPDLLPFVFDRFRQADSSTTRAHGGLGLGLAIVRHLVELHGGTVQARSPGDCGGATFVVELPVSGPRAGAAEASGTSVTSPAAAGAPERLDGMRILVVDDDRDSLEPIASALRGLGADVDGAVSAEEARRILERVRPDVVVTDIAMPGEDGFGLLRHVRSAPDGRIPAVALTAYARPQDRERALAAGFDAHLPKPVAAADLACVVAELARRGRR